MTALLPDFMFFVLPFVVLIACVVYLIVRLSRRPKGFRSIEAWALVPGGIGFVWQIIDTVHGIETSTSSTEALGYMVLPWASCIAGLVGYLIGWSALAVSRAALRLLRKRTIQRRALGQAAAGCVILAAAISYWVITARREALISEAKSEATSEARICEMFREAAADWDVGVLRELARNPRTPVRILRDIYALALTKTGDKWGLARNYEVALRLAENDHTPEEILSELSGRNENAIRGTVASNPNTPGPALEALSQDADHVVRTSVCQNPRVPRDLLRRLSSDPHPVVRDYAASAWEHHGFSNDPGQ